MVVIGAVMIQLALGAIYAWSVFTKPLKESGWTVQDTQMVFSAGLATFAIIMVIAGRFLQHPKVGPRRLAMASGVVLSAGYILAGIFGAENFVSTLFFVGILGGAGIGIGYVVPIAVGIKWFPDKKGLITGLAVAGFGFGATLWMTLADKLGPLGGAELLKNLGVSGTFIAFGVAYFILVEIGSYWMTFPAEGYKPAGWNPPQATSAKPLVGSVTLTSWEMLRTHQFYLILLTFAFVASAGLMSIGLMKLWPMKAMGLRGIPAEQASAIATLAMAVFFALFNGLGRIIWGMISDKIGRKLSIIIMAATQGVFVFLFQYMAGTEYTLYLFAMLIGFNFGGTFALFPTLTADTFGTKYVGMNYGWVFLAYAIGGIAGPIMGGKLGDMGNFPLAFTICGILCIVAVITISLVKPVKKPA